jgi:predicted esterase
MPAEEEPMLDAMRNYPPLAPEDVRVYSRRAAADLTRETLIFQTPFGYRRVAELFHPQAAIPIAAILFVHWYEPHAPDSNRSQFVEEAMEFARLGALCLCVETLWSDLDFFIKRTQADDLRNSMEEVVNLRRFMDFMMGQPGADAHRFALVGHDFGAMYGALAGSLDRRPSHYVLMAGTPRFPDWYLYAPPLEGEARDSFIRSMSPFDPIAHIGDLSLAPIFFQFGADDPHVPPERAREFYSAAGDPREMKVYTAGHGLNEEATRDRRGWLKEQLGL